jgi:transcriptional regulator with XRE-family HTH domain
MMPKLATKPTPVFGGNLAKHRRICGLTQRQLADMLKMSAKAVDYYERRAANPNADFVKKVALALGTSPDALLGYEDKKPHKPGPPPQILSLLENVMRLPKAKQRMAVQFLETLVKTG